MLLSNTAIMYKLYSALFLLSLLPSYSRGWSLLSSSSSSSSSSLLSSSSSSTPSSSISSPGRTTTTTTTTITITPTRNNDEVVVGVSRADAMNNIATKLIMIGTAGVTTGFYLVGGDVQVVHADVTNKVASTTSIRSLERMKTLFPIKVLPLVEMNDFLAVYGSLREPPFDSIRKNAKTLVLGGEDLGVQANELEKQYKILISALEKIDNTASKGTRNSNKFSSLQMKEEYDTLLIALDSFLKLGIETSQIPIQQQQQQQQQLE